MICLEVILRRLVGMIEEEGKHSRESKWILSDGCVTTVLHRLLILYFQRKLKEREMGGGVHQTGS